MQKNTQVKGFEAHKKRVIQGIRERERLFYNTKTNEVKIHVIKNNGENKRISSRSRTGPLKNNGKKAPGADQPGAKTTVKYTLNRTNHDILKLDELRQVLKNNNQPSNYKTDSQLYRELPVLYLNAINQIQSMQLTIDKLTMENTEMKQIHEHIAYVFNIFNNNGKSDNNLR